MGSYGLSAHPLTRLHSDLLAAHKAVGCNSTREVQRSQSDGEVVVFPTDNFYPIYKIYPLSGCSISKII